LTIHCRVGAGLTSATTDASPTITPWPGTYCMMPAAHWHASVMGGQRHQKIRVRMRRLRLEALAGFQR
jgi:hypothetical protein